MTHGKSIPQTVAEIDLLFSTYGFETYEENCTQLQHAQQSGTLALEQGMDLEFALAAFLHDVGHFVAHARKPTEVGAYGYADHGALGADYLAELGFSARIVNMVREHVQVKRYLTRARKGYASQLSHASRVTLQQQGGPMSQAEADIYSENSQLADIVKLREIDDSGKRPAMACKTLQFWLEAIDEQLQLSRR